MQVETLTTTSKKHFTLLRAKIARKTTLIKWLAADLVRAKGMKLLSQAKFAHYFLLMFTGNQNGLRCLMEAHRFYPTESLTKEVQKKLNLLLENIDLFVHPVPRDEFDMVASRSIVLKQPVGKTGKVGFEKGVVLITFTEAFPFFSRYVDIGRLLQSYYVVLEPSWAGYCNPNILFWMKYGPHRITVQATEQKDYSFLNSLNSNLIPVDFGASDWVDFRIFRPLPGLSKKFDAIYVCTYKPIKRHHVFFDAVRRINDPTYKVALLCVSWGGTRSAIEHLIDHYEIRNNITLYENCPPQQVNEFLNMSKVNVLFSLKEGSNRSIFEGFFSNVPCIVLKNNIGVNKTYVNDMTGKLISEKELKGTLLHFREKWEQYHPRDWALNNISPLVTAKKLSEHLRKIAQGNNEPWTRDLVPKVNAPEVTYFFENDKDRFPDSSSFLSAYLKTEAQERRAEVRSMR